jgi:Fibronectin type III domain
MTTPAGAVASDTRAAQRQAAAGTKPAPKGGDSLFSRKYGPLPGWGWALLAGGGALAFFWWRSRESKTTTATTASTTPATGTGWANAANALQAEITALQGSSATSVTTTKTSTGSGTTTTKTGKTTTTTSTSKPGPVEDLTVTSKSDTSVVVAWRPPQFASHAPTSTTYTIQVKPKDAKAHNIGSRTSYNVGALKPDTKYTVVVAAAGGPSTSKSFTTEKKK